jgi:phosphoribosylanthranilate isomerase
VVKICGLRDPEHAATAASAGADLIGFIFAPARRQVTATKARQCIAAAREAFLSTLRRAKWRVSPRKRESTRCSCTVLSHLSRWNSYRCPR